MSILVVTSGGGQILEYNKITTACILQKINLKDNQQGIVYCTQFWLHSVFLFFLLNYQCHVNVNKTCWFPCAYCEELRYVKALKTLLPILIEKVKASDRENKPNLQLKLKLKEQNKYFVLTPELDTLLQRGTVDSLLSSPDLMFSTNSIQLKF